MAIDWPPGFDRTPEGERVPNRSFSVSLATAAEDLETELDRLADDWRVDFGNQHAKSNGMPLYNANPSDPGFVARWTTDDGDHAVACDAYQSLKSNVRAVYLWIRETRLRSQRPVETGAAEFAAARLPPAGEDQTAVPMPEVDAETAYDILDVPRDADEDEVRAAYRERVKDVHPDQGGSDAAYRRVQDAKGVLLDG